MAARAIKRPSKVSAVRRKKQAPQEVIDSLHRDLVELANVKTERAACEDKEKEISARCLSVFTTYDVGTSQKTTDGSTVVTGTFVQGKKPVLNEAMLKKKIGATMWRKVCTLMLDYKKLGAYVSAGEISATVVAECSEDKLNQPYIKITRK